MTRWIVRILSTAAILLLLLAILAAAYAFWTVRRSFPRVDGEISVPGLQDPVEVYRDAHGIPHIYAGNTHDLFFAQGYVHAQDRFWQMDFWRHISSGRLSEMFGQGSLDTDRFLRTMGWARVARQELELLDPAERQILEAYAAGVNAYLSDRQGSELSLEYAILGLTNPDYQIEPWEPLHSLAWAKVMAWDLRGNMDMEIERAILSSILTPEQLAEIFPDYPEDAPVIVPGPYDYATGGASSTNRRSTGAHIPPGAIEGLSRVARRSAGMRALLGPDGPGIGSNNWTISGALTDSGMPLLANDPHLGVQMPSIWYEIGLHCTPKGPDCPYEVAGYSFAGAPGVIIGHNDRIAWGLTNVDPDVQDLYIEKINPENPDQYEYEGRWEEMTLVEETLRTAEGDEIPLTVRYTRHGPIISDTYGPLDGFSERAGEVELPERYAISLRWTALEPNLVFRAIWNLNRAQNWEDFRQAASYFTVPAQNLVYADVDGNIGYQMPGNIPIRLAGDGRQPVPGWTGEYEWAGYIPFEELPRLFNPEQGYITTANHAVVDESYPYLISTDWDYGPRARRITELIESAAGSIDIETLRQIQGDNYNLNAKRLVPYLLQLQFEDPPLQAAQSLLSGWDYQNDMDSGTAAVFEAFWRHLLNLTFLDDLPLDYQPSGSSRWSVIVSGLVEQPQSAWWDIQTTAGVETRNEIFRRAFESGVAELETLLGDNPDQWAWGDLHTVSFRNASLGESGIAPIEALFNRGPYPTAGGSGIVNATSWDAGEGYTVSSLPSMRMIVDLGDLQNSLAVNTLGQSGHAYHPHYDDMVDLWREIEFHPMHWEREVIEAEGGGHLRLLPSDPG